MSRRGPRSRSFRPTSLCNGADRQPLIVVATRADGVTLDVTAQAQGDAGRSGLRQARRPHALSGGRRRDDAQGRVRRPVARTFPVKVDAATADRPISFKLDVMPVFMRAGCNTGSCHGAARGKDGFRLSLFGFDPDGDHFRLTREIGGRRINLAVPAESLLLEKVDRRGAAHRRQAVRRRQRVLPDAAPLARSRRPERRRRRRHGRVGVELYPPQAVLEGEGRHAAARSSGPSTPTAPTAT